MDFRLVVDISFSDDAELLRHQSIIIKTTEDKEWPKRQADDIIRIEKIKQIQSRH